MLNKNGYLPLGAEITIKKAETQYEQEKSIMQSLTNKAETYLNGRWQQQRDYYSKQSTRNKRLHQNFLLFSSVSALVVPVLPVRGTESPRLSSGG